MIERNKKRQKEGSAELDKMREMVKAKLKEREEEDLSSTTDALVFFHDDLGLLLTGCLAFLDGDGDGEVELSLIR